MGGKGGADIHAAEHACDASLASGILERQPCRTMIDPDQRSLANLF
ncbi:MAG: hypothetical protein AVDCRST_MAG87-3564 [uncultured Thermomicrobiales bacterium]|uniref:Uncharacterized protein n=1 Tax=uncultured Thermomicrobiales bacterium TaxID=1645740 RepID=A0A6J4VP26_9BACT|nr:MAG: hypothetical protein AVDCRST_MAG87-3564 [uncultured Thermomicrobiales bacterium]